MKFIFEAIDLTAGRKVVMTSRSGRGAEFMVFVDNAIGGADRFGLVGTDTGIVAVRGMRQTALADHINASQVPFAPVSIGEAEADGG